MDQIWLKNFSEFKITYLDCINNTRKIILLKGTVSVLRFVYILTDISRLLCGKNTSLDVVVS
jgi:hypothetical protein